MIKIKCQNPNKDPNKGGCTARDGEFEWDPGFITAITQNVEGAESYIAICPICKNKNKIWLTYVPLIHNIMGCSPKKKEDSE